MPKEILDKMYVGLLLAAFLASCNEPPVPPDGGGGEEDDLSAYITDVFEYVYAPGQHAPTRTSADASLFVGKPDRELYLGGFGGYVVAGFDHDVPNRGGADFEVYSSGIDAEPAVVWVMADDNGDGLPNDTWYELAGSETEDWGTIRRYELTYYKPGKGRNVRWRDSEGRTGELEEGNKKDPATGMPMPTDSWWWGETTEDSITFQGTRLPDAYYNSGTVDEPYWEVFPDMFAWGYAENNKGEDYDTKSKGNRLDISHAIDSLGLPEKLETIRFIKVQSAVFQRAGWLNEISPEVKGAKDLHY